MIYEIIGYKKILAAEREAPYGTITLQFSSDSFKDISTKDLQQFIALSLILKDENVGYDPQKKKFFTNVPREEFDDQPHGVIE